MSGELKERKKILTYSPQYINAVRVCDDKLENAQSLSEDRLNKVKGIEKKIIPLCNSLSEISSEVKSIKNIESYLDTIALDLEKYIQESYNEQIDFQDILQEDIDKLERYIFILFFIFTYLYSYINQRKNRCGIYQRFRSQIYMGENQQNK